MKKIFILHGWTYSKEKWTAFVEYMKKNNVEVVLPSIPGLTDTINKPWNLDDYVEWLHNTLQKEKNITLVGHSNGGRIALAFAHTYPHMLQKLILIDSAGIYHNEISIQIKRSIFKLVASIGKQFTSSETLRQLLYKLTGESDYKKASPSMRETLVNLTSKDLTPVLSDIRTPTVIIWGKHDTVTPLSDGKRMNSQIKNSKLYVIDTAKHSPYFTHAQEVGEIILKNI